MAIKCLTKPNVNPTTPSLPTADEGAEELACHATLRYHDHLVNLLHHFETDAHTYLVLEYCSQGDLYEAIRLGRGPLETEHVRDFMLQLVGAVEHMHSRGLYHRDIKPENIFIMQDGSMKLGDFGLATRSLWCYESSVGSDRSWLLSNMIRPEMVIRLPRRISGQLGFASSTSCSLAIPS